MNQKKSKRFKTGDFIKVVRIPPGLKNMPGMNTIGVFQRALGKTFPIEGFDEHGHLELLVASKGPDKSRIWDLDTIWIEPEFVMPAERPSKKTKKNLR